MKKSSPALPSFNSDKAFMVSEADLTHHLMMAPTIHPCPRCLLVEADHRPNEREIDEDF